MLAQERVLSNTTSLEIFKLEPDFKDLYLSRSPSRNDHGLSFKEGEGEGNDAVLVRQLPQQVAVQVGPFLVDGVKVLVEVVSVGIFVVVAGPRLLGQHPLGLGPFFCGLPVEQVPDAVGVRRVEDVPETSGQRVAAVVSSTLVGLVAAADGLQGSDDLKKSKKISVWTFFKKLKISSNSTQGPDQLVFS